MDSLDNLSNDENGTIKCPNDKVKDEVIGKLISQGFSESISAILPPMTFRLQGQTKQEAIPSEPKYTVVYRGR